MNTIKIIGVGRMGSSIAYTLMLGPHDLDILLSEPLAENQKKAEAELWDLAPVAKATGNTISLVPMGEQDYRCNLVIVTAGKARTSPEQTKHSLLKANQAIVEDATLFVPPSTPIFIVTNPPIELARELRRRGHTNVIPLRKCTDKLRGKKVNEFVLVNKGHTMWTPAYACAKEIINHMSKELKASEQVKSEKRTR